MFALLLAVMDRLKRVFAFARALVMPQLDERPAIQQVRADLSPMERIRSYKTIPQVEKEFKEMYPRCRAAVRASGGLRDCKVPMEGSPSDVDLLWLTDDWDKLMNPGMPLHGAPCDIWDEDKEELHKMFYEFPEHVFGREVNICAAPLDADAKTTRVLQHVRNEQMLNSYPLLAAQGIFAKQHPEYKTERAWGDVLGLKGCQYTQMARPMEELKVIAERKNDKVYEAVAKQQFPLLCAQAKFAEERLPHEAGLAWDRVLRVDRRNYTSKELLEICKEREAELEELIRRNPTLDLN